MNDAGRALTPEQEILVRLSAALAARDLAGLGVHMRRAAHMDLSASIEESLLQSYLFLGFPAALTAVALWKKLSGEDLPEADPLAEPTSVDDWVGRGEAVCRSVYGPTYDKLRRNVMRMHPAMDRWMITEGYGKVLGRPGLDLVDRELCIVALLTVAAWESQLHSHLRGALNVGASPEAVSGAVETGLEYVDDPDWADAARRLWRRVESWHRTCS